VLPDEGVAALAARFGAARVEAVDLDLTDQLVDLSLT
jgi:hypothetical protein